MLKIKIEGKVATWEYPECIWKCKDNLYKQILQLIFDYNIRKTIGSRDVYMDGGVCMKVWQYTKEELQELVVLVSLEPEETSKEKNGVYY